MVLRERGKPECPEKKLPEQGREPTTNSSHIWRRCRDFNPSHWWEVLTTTPSLNRNQISTTTTTTTSFIQRRWVLKLI